MMTPLHLLYVLLDDQEGLGVQILKKIGANVSRIQSMTDSELYRLPKGSGGTQLMPDPAYTQVILDARSGGFRWGSTFRLEIFCSCG
jgi:ATP-dependent Clp protease ATP-binding subunit ClpA